MRKIALLLVLLFINTCYLYAQGWSQEQIEKADLARNIAMLTETEKDAIKYINLCRMYPREFAEIEVRSHSIDSLFGDDALRDHAESKQSLISQLQNQRPTGPLYFNEALYLDAKCYADEISKNERQGHERKDCPSTILHAECISFGMPTGKEIVFQWLLDTGVPSLGHRNICLDPNYKNIGLKAESHFKWAYCAVGEFY